MPGVVVTTSARSGPTTPLSAASGQFFMVGVFERGPVTPTVIRGVADLKQVYGGRVAYSDGYDHLATFFSEGGEQARVVRVVGDAAAKGTLTLSDRASVSPLPTLKVDAANAGSWSSNLSVEVAAGSNTGTFRLIVRLGADVVEDFNNLSTPADAATRTQGSNYVVVTNLGSTTSSPDNNPAVAAAATLTAGTDDRNAIVAANYVTGLDKFPKEDGDGAVAVPGQDNSTVRNALITHAQNNNRIALLAGAKDETVNSLISAASSLNSQYAGLFAPWIVVPTDGAATKAIGPEGYVAAARSRAHRLDGPWRAPAGQIATANYVLDVYQNFSGTDANKLDDSKVSVVRRINNTIRLYGWRSLSNNFDSWAYLKDADLINRIVLDASQRIEQYMFEPIDSRNQLQSLIVAELGGMLQPIADRNGLFAKYDDEGNEVDPGYIVNAGDDINPVSSLTQNRINVEISLRVSPTAAWINLSITKVNPLGAL